jgi:hypothetical protein
VTIHGWSSGARRRPAAFRALQGFWERGRPKKRRKPSAHAAARPAAARLFVVSGAGASKSAGTENRARSRGAVVRLGPFLPLGASLTRLGVPYGPYRRGTGRVDP